MPQFIPGIQLLAHFTDDGRAEAIATLLVLCQEVAMISGMAAPEMRRVQQSVRDGN
jgi:hypothetical protein